MFGIIQGPRVIRRSQHPRFDTTLRRYTRPGTRDSILDASEASFSIILGGSATTASTMAEIASLECTLLANRRDCGIRHQQPVFADRAGYGEGDYAILRNEDSTIR